MLQLRAVQQTAHAHADRVMIALATAASAKRSGLRQRYNRRSGLGRRHRFREPRQLAANLADDPGLDAVTYRAGMHDTPSALLARGRSELDRPVDDHLVESKPRYD